MTVDTFKILYFAELWDTLDEKYRGIKEGILLASMVTVNFEYVEGLDWMVKPGDEVAIIPPVSAG
ncbi:Molybdopterin synthase sulfur carrier subunit [Geopyxis carbonaria]|nr:Molybdopterin synthase sulfur carrier subunit [Geopyxis carbonaria]